MEATAEQAWVPEGKDQLDALEERGLLTEVEVYQVRLTIDLVIALVRIGRISQHFGDWIIKRLAREMAAKHASDPWSA